LEQTAKVFRSHTKLIQDFNNQIMKFFKKFVASLVFTLLLAIPIASAISVNSTIGIQNYTKYNSGAIEPIISTYTWGSAGTPWAEGHFTDLYTVTLAVSGTVTGDLDMNGNDIINIDMLTGDSAPIKVGAGTIDQGVMVDDDDLYVSDDFEVDGQSFFNQVFYPDAQSNFIGNSNDSGFRWANDQTNHALVWFTETGSAAQSGNFILTTADNRTKDHGLGTTTNPRYAIFSGNDPTSSPNEYLSIHFDPTIPGAVLDTGSGTVRIGTTLSFEPSADQARLDDSAVDCSSSGITRVVGSGGAVLLDTDPAMVDGVADGQTCILQGTSDANTVQIADGNNIELNQGVDFTMGIGDTLWAIWDSGDSTWYETSRSDN
jgi:hypothetical protein